MPSEDREPVAAASAMGAWRRPRVEQHGLRRYAETLQEHFRLILLCVAVTTGAAVLYLATASKTYEAQAEMLITPLVGDQATSIGLGGVLRESSDPTRDVETASRLVTTRDVAARVVRRLDLSQTTTKVLQDVKAEPVAQSNIVAITATAEDPAEARDLANAFGQEVVAERTAQLHSQLDRAIPSLRTQVQAAGASETAQALATQLSTLQALRAQNDPTMRLETRAVAPESAASPKPAFTIVAGILGGLVLGIGGAFGIAALDPKLRREEQLREGYTLPILTRIPSEKQARTSFREGGRVFGRRHRRALSPADLSPLTLEAYRTLRAMLGVSSTEHDGARSVLVTGSSPSEGKTTTAINLAASLALAGNRVILIEADFRRPTVGQAFGLKPTVSIGRVLLGQTRLDDALLPAEPFGNDLRVLPADPSDEWVSQLLARPTSAQAFLEEARALADYVVIDSPPLSEVIDALPLVRQVDDVVVVVRIGSTRLSQLGRLGDILEQNGIEPTGFAVVGVGSSQDETYYLRSQRERLADQSQAARARERELSRKPETTR